MPPKGRAASLGCAGPCPGQGGRIGGRRPQLSPHQQAEIKKIVSKGGRIAADAARQRFGNRANNRRQSFSRDVRRGRARSLPSVFVDHGLTAPP